MQACLPGNKVSTSGHRSNYRDDRSKTSIIVSAYSKNLPVLFPQHGPGKKHDRTIGLAPWQREFIQADPRGFIRGLLHSDGCRFINTGTNWRCPRYSFSNRSEDIRKLLCWACGLLDLHTTRAPHTVYISRKADVARLDEFVGPKS